METPTVLTPGDKIGPDWRLDVPLRGNFAAAPRNSEEFDPTVLAGYLRLAEKHAAAYERLIRQRATALGIPQEAFGFDLTRGKLCNPKTLLGGGLDQFGIEADAAVLMPTRMRGYSPTWEKATVLDRIEAVLVHEWVEHQVAVAMGTNWEVATSHQLAAQFGVAVGKQMKVSSSALNILQEISAAAK